MPEYSQVSEGKKKACIFRYYDISREISHTNCIKKWKDPGMDESLVDRKRKSRKRSMDERIYSEGPLIQRSGMQLMKSKNNHEG